MVRKLDPETESLDRALRSRVAESPRGPLVEALGGGTVRCHACGHRCTIADGHDGICRVRFNRGGKLFVPRGYVAGLQADPVEKKPFFHVLPGAQALSFGMLGCDYHCPYCQNWLTSQTLRDPQAQAGPRDVTAADIVATAVRLGTPLMVSTYNEPLITAEWAVEVFTAARARGILCGFVSNGNATPEVLEVLRPVVDLFKVDLKGFREPVYRAMGGRLQTVLDAIVTLHASGFWLEVVTLLVPGLNDGDAEIAELARYLASVSRDIPWHVTAFHADYRMTAPADTSAADLRRAAAIGRDAGLRFVYAGNLPGQVGDLEDTRCPACAAVVVERRGYSVARRGLDAAGRCSACGAAVPGIWSSPSPAAAVIRA